MPLRVLVYSHDTYGLGNIRRMLAVSDHLLQAVPDVSVLLVTGSPMVHEFRIRPGLDYIKLPCLSRVGRDEYSAKSLGTGISQLMQLRSGLILAAARDFNPDVVLVDKKPDGVKHELKSTLAYLKKHRPRCRVALVLRDILDTAESTIASWKERKYFDTIREYFESILILGGPTVFDAAKEYAFPEDIRRRTRYCGYLRRPAPSLSDSSRLRETLLRRGESRMVLVTPGGGEDGFALVRDYAKGATRLKNVRSFIVCGPEMPGEQRSAIEKLLAGQAGMSVTEFTGDMMAYMGAADAVVSMAGYNTVCEILSLKKRAVTVPRAHPVQEQWIRGERMARLGLLEAIHPDGLTPGALMDGVERQLEAGPLQEQFPASLEGLEGVARWVRESATRARVVATTGRMTWNVVSVMS